MQKWRYGDLKLLTNVPILSSEMWSEANLDILYVKHWALYRPHIESLRVNEWVSRVWHPTRHSIAVIFNQGSGICQGFRGWSVKNIKNNLACEITSNKTIKV